jgi:hypothetical protein
MKYIVTVEKTQIINLEFDTETEEEAAIAACDAIEAGEVDESGLSFELTVEMVEPA